ncbi:unnamed protein product, partial [Didymodactylos carnosus]
PVDDLAHPAAAADRHPVGRHLARHPELAPGGRAQDRQQRRRQPPPADLPLGQLTQPPSFPRRREPMPSRYSRRSMGLRLRGDDATPNLN